MKEGRIKQAMDVDAQKFHPVVEGTGDSASAAPTSSKLGTDPTTRPTPPVSASTDRPLNELGVPIFSS